MVNRETRKLSEVEKIDNNIGAWWCPACNEVRRNELVTQIETSEAADLYIGYFEDSKTYESPRKQGSRTKTNMVAVFFKNGSVLVVSENDLTPTTKTMKSQPIERALATLQMLLVRGVKPVLEPNLTRKQRIAELKGRCRIQQVRALRGWSTRNNREESQRKWRLVATWYSKVDLDKILDELGKTRRDEFDDDECRSIGTALRRADFK